MFYLSVVSLSVWLVNVKRAYQPHARRSVWYGSQRRPSLSKKKNYKMNRTDARVQEWDRVGRYTAMRQALRYKFAAHPDMADVLVNTGDMRIVERAYTVRLTREGGLRTPGDGDCAPCSRATRRAARGSCESAQTARRLA